MFSCFSDYLDQVAGSACLADARRTFFAKLAVICRVRGSRWVHKFIRKAESFAHGDIAQPALRVAYASSVLPEASCRTPRPVPIIFGKMPSTAQWNPSATEGDHYKVAARR